MDTNSSVGHVKTKDIFEDVAKYVEKRFDTSSDKLERSLSQGIKQKKLSA